MLVIHSLDAGQAVDRSLQAGIDAMRAGNLSQARIELERAVRQQPDNAQAHFQFGLLMGQTGNVPAAAAAFRKALLVNSNFPEAHYNLGLTMVAETAGKRDWPGAIAEFQEALRLRPDYVEARHLLGVALGETGRRDASITELRAALSADPNSASIHLDLGKALESAGDEGGAEREYRAAAQLRSGNADAEIALGKLLAKEESHQLEAIEHFRQALRANPDLPAAQYGLARLLQGEGKQAEAAIAFRQAAALSRRQEDAVQCTRLSNAGLDAAHGGDFAAALRSLRDAVALRPDAPVAHYNLGLVLADQKDFAAARAQLVQAISLASADPRFYLALGRVCQQTGDSRHARAALERAAALDPGSAAAPQNTAPHDPLEFGAETDTPDAHFAFATVLANGGDWLGAVGEWLRVLAERPDNVDARNNLGISYTRLSTDDAAELEFRKALQVAPDSAGAHFGLAMLNMQHGNKSDAVRELQQVLRVQPDYPQARNLLALASK